MWITTRKDINMEMFNPPHPGIILLEDFIKAYEFTISEFALKIGTIAM